MHETQRHLVVGSSKRSILKFWRPLSTKIQVVVNFMNWSNRVLKHAIESADCDNVAVLVQRKLIVKANLLFDDFIENMLWANGMLLFDLQNFSS